MLEEPAWEIPANFVYLEYTSLVGNSRGAKIYYVDFVDFEYTLPCIFRKYTVILKVTLLSMCNLPQNGTT